MAARRTLQRALILQVLLQAPHASWYGLEVIRDSGLRSGTVYPALAALERDGLLQSSWEDCDPSAERRPRRRLYCLVADRVTEAAGYAAAFETVLSPKRPRAGTPSLGAPRGATA
jgi:PadR family transcriptional regulator PadR